MHSPFKKIITAIKFFGAAAIAVALTVPSLTSAASIYDRANSGFQKMVNSAYGGGNAVTINQGTFVATLIAAINYLLGAIGIVFFVLLVYAGYLWLNARGEQEQVEKAKKIIREVIVGLLIIILARIITELILVSIHSALEP